MIRRALSQVFLLSVATRLVQAATTLLLIRRMPEGQYAAYIFLVAGTATVTGLLGSAFNNLYIVGERDLRIRGTSDYLGFQLLCAAALIPITLPFAGGLAGMYWWGVALVFATLRVQYAMTIFQRELIFIGYSGVELARALVILIGCVLLAWRGGGALGAREVILAQTAAGAGVFALAYGGRAGELRHMAIRPVLRLFAEIGRSDYRFLVAYVAVLAIFSQIDVFLLKSLSSAHELATYGAAARYYGLLGMGLGALHVVYSPVIQQARDNGQCEEAFREHRRLLAWFIPVVALAFACAGWIVPLLDGGKYPGSVAVFRLLGVSAVFSFMFSPHVHVLFRLRDFRMLFRFVVGSLVINGVVCAVLVSQLGAVGAAIGTLLGFGMLNGTIFLRSRVLRAGWAAGDLRSTLALGAVVEPGT